MPASTDPLLLEVAAAETALARLASPSTPAPGALGELRAALGRLRTLLDALPRTRGAGVEIERKYLLGALPPTLAGRPACTIEQGYLPGVRLVERLRREQLPDGSVRRWRTVKAGEGIARLEIEEATDEALFEALWPHTAGRRVLKRRHVVPDGALRWEIDEFTDRDLVLAEVELADAGARPEPPGWLAPYVVREVTGERAYVNAVLAR